MTREQRLELLKQIEKDIYVPSIESTFLDEAKSCAIHSVIEELEQDLTTKNNLGVDAISRADAIRVASGYCHPSNVAKELAKLPSIGRYDPYTDKFIIESNEEGGSR